MNDMSHMSFNKIRKRKIALEDRIDKLAGELSEANKELAERFGLFKELCVAPGTTVSARVTGKRGTLNSKIV
jgi:hypothetical protein